MSTFEDEISRAMTGHDDEAPRAEDLLRSLEQAPPRRRLAGWYGPIAVAAAVVAVVAGSLWGVRALGHQAAPAAAALTCPARYARQAPWVPAKPAGVDGRARLVPQQTPSSAVICGYAGSDEAKQQAGWALSGRRALTGNLAGLAAQLSWQARLLPGHGYWCAGAGGRQVNYLVGLTYPGGGTMWVTATDEPGECVTAANGEFTSMGAIGPQVSKAFASGRWPARPPVSCNSASGRLGQDTAMVPAGATSVTICATKAHRTVTSGYQTLVRALDRLRTGPSDGSCSMLPGSSSGPDYELLFSYPEGPAAAVFVNADCHPAIDNGNLQSASASSVVPIIQQLLKAK